MVDEWVRVAAQTEEQEEQVAKVEAMEAMVGKVVTAVVTAELVATAEMEVAWVVATAEMEVVWAAARALVVPSAALLAAWMADKPMVLQVALTVVARTMLHLLRKTAEGRAFWKALQGYDRRWRTHVPLRRVGQIAA